MSENEAALYGSLVKHLRELWAEQAAQFNESSLAKEKARIDEIIRAWFFTPQPEELSGLTPREMIRNDEKGQPNTVPHSHPGEDYHADCPLCRLLNDSPPGMGGEWHIGLAPDSSLLDDYDPEGYNAKWDEPAPKPADDDEAGDPDEEVSDAPAKEARTWLEQNPNNNCFAGNRFYDKQEALDFVKRLYDLGALVVLVDNIFDEPYRLREQGGPYADTFNVYLPPDPKARGDIRAIFEHELLELQGLELKRYEFGDLLMFWWD